MYVKDVKSSNGTFVNEERLSNEGEESEPRELHDQDEIEFGIDILNDHGASEYMFTSKRRDGFTQQQPCL